MWSSDAVSCGSSSHTITWSARNSFSAARTACLPQPAPRVDAASPIATRIARMGAPSEEDRQAAGVLLAVAGMVFVEQRPVAGVDPEGDLLLERDLEATARAERHQGLVLVDEVVDLGPDVGGAGRDAGVRADHRAGHQAEHEAQAAEEDVLVAARRQPGEALDRPVRIDQPRWPEQEHALAVEQPGRERQADAGVADRRRAEDRALDRLAHADEHALVAGRADLEREYHVADDPAGGAVVELDLEPVVAGAALQHLEHLAALGVVDLAVARVGPGMDRRALRDHPQVGLGAGLRREQRERRGQAERRDEQEAAGAHLNQSRKTCTAGSDRLAKMSPPLCASIPASGLVRNGL